MQQVNDNGVLTQFKCDDTSNRIVKRGGVGLETVYVNAWYTAGPGRNQKHVFAGATRIVSKLEMPPTGSGQGGGASNLAEVDQYFYHQDHLGSTGYVTGFDGEVYQHLEYFPFGEQWVNEVVDNTRVRYRFTGKEYDGETGLYYFGARYYDPRTSAWQSPDPAVGAFLSAGKPQNNMPDLSTDWRAHLGSPGGGGVFEPKNLNSFGYVHQDPVRLTDPDGRCPMCVGAVVVCMETGVCEVAAATAASWAARLAVRWALRKGAEEIAKRVIPEVAKTISTQMAGEEEASGAPAAEETDKADVLQGAEKGTRRKNRIEDRGEPGTIKQNPSDTTRKKYGKDGWVEKEWNKGHGPNPDFSPASP
jgi:RHS repeat-associated protein